MAESLLFCKNCINCEMEPDRPLDSKCKASPKYCPIMGTPSYSYCDLKNSKYNCRDYVEKEDCYVGTMPPDELEEVLKESGLYSDE